MTDDSSYAKLDQSFYTRPDVVEIARDLLGKILFTNIDGKLTAGKIIETEAYNGRCDKACHAFLKRTKRTETMYQAGGRAYIYLCYGIHHLFNIVTNKEGLADAVLIRAVEPLFGMDEMRSRRGNLPLRQTSNGPGKLSQALGLHTSYNGTRLIGNEIWISESENTTNFGVVSDVRVGVDYAGEDALLPWRFYIDDNPYISVKKKTPN